MIIARNMKIWRNLKIIISLNYYISLIYYISPDLFSFGRSARFCQKFFIVKNSNIGIRGYMKANKPNDKCYPTPAEIESGSS